MISRKIHHIKVGDTVKVISGNYKGTLGVISEINNKKSLANIDTILPRIKPIKSKGEGNIKHKELKVFIHISNFMQWKNPS